MFNNDNDDDDNEMFCFILGMQSYSDYKKNMPTSTRVKPSDIAMHEVGAVRFPTSHDLSDVPSIKPSSSKSEY